MQCLMFLVALSQYYSEYRRGPISELQIRGGNGDNSKIIFSHFSTKTYIVTLIRTVLMSETVLMMGHKISFYGEMWLIIP